MMLIIHRNVYKQQVTNHFGRSVVVCVVCSFGKPCEGGGLPAVVDETSSTH